MPRNNNNVFTYTDPTPAVSGQKILASWMNGKFTDINSALNSSLPRTGGNMDLNWVFTGPHNFINLPTGIFDSLLPIFYLNPTINTVAVSNTNPLTVNFTNDNRWVRLTSATAIAPSSINLTFNNDLRLGTILVLQTSNVSTNSLLTLNITTSKPSNLLLNCAVFMQKFADGIHVINTVNYDYSGSNLYPITITSLPTKNLYYQPLYPEDSRAHIATTIPTGNGATNTITFNKNPPLSGFYGGNPWWNFVAGDIIAQVAFLTLNYLSYSSVGGNRRYMMNYNQTDYASSTGKAYYYRPIFFFGGTKFYFCASNVPGATLIPSGEVDTGSNAYRTDYSAMYLVNSVASDNYSLTINPQFNPITTWISAGYNFGLDNSGSGRFQLAIINPPMARFGTTFNYLPNTSFELYLNNVTYFSNINTASGHVVLSIVDNNYNPCVMNSITNLTYMTLDNTATDFDPNSDYSSSTAMATLADNYYSTTGGCLISNYCGQRQNDYYTSLSAYFPGATVEPNPVWGRPHASLTNGYLRFTKISNNHYNFSGVLSTKLQSGVPYPQGTGKAYGKLYLKNAFVTSHITGTCDLSNAAALVFSNIYSDSVYNDNSGNALTYPLSSTRIAVLPGYNDPDAQTRPTSINSVPINSDNRYVALTIDKNKLISGYKTTMVEDGQLDITYFNAT